MRHNKFVRGGKFVILILLIGTAAIFASMFLWNGLMVSLFNLPVLSFWQTLGLMILGRLLTGGFFHKGRGSHGCHSKSKWNEKWQSMTEEEKTEFKQKHDCRNREAFCN